MVLFDYGELLKTITAYFIDGCKLAYESVDVAIAPALRLLTFKGLRSVPFRKLPLTRYGLHHQQLATYINSPERVIPFSAFYEV